MYKCPLNRLVVAPPSPPMSLAKSIDVLAPELAAAEYDVDAPVSCVQW